MAPLHFSPRCFTASLVSETDTDINNVAIIIGNYVSSKWVVGIAYLTSDGVHGPGVTRMCPPILQRLVRFTILGIKDGS